MNFDDIVTDMACEAAENVSAGELVTAKELSNGIVERVLNVKNAELAAKIGRERGVYVTYDCPGKLFLSKSARRALAGYISHMITSLSGRLKKTSPVLVVGLGNGDVAADSLGEQVAKGVEVTREDRRDAYKQSVCAFSTGVLGTTGMQSADIAKAICDSVKPSLVILVDSLATGVVERVGTSFQLSTAGISPGSGVGQDKQRIDKSVLKAPTISIGVPLMLSLRTALYGFVKEYVEELGYSVHEFRLRAKLVEKNLSRLVVTPKDVKAMATCCADIISDAINEAFR